MAPSARVLSMKAKDNVLNVITLGLNTGRMLKASLSPYTIPTITRGGRTGRVISRAFSVIVKGVVSSGTVRSRTKCRGCSVMATGVLTSILVPLAPMVMGRVGGNTCCVASNVLSIGRRIMIRTMGTTNLAIMRIARRNR